MPEIKIVSRFPSRILFNPAKFDCVLKSQLVSCLLMICFSLSQAQQAGSNVSTPPAQVKDFMDQRFGMFIHFGPVTLRGTEIGWSRNKEVPQADYDNLYKEFNPVLFDANTWVKTAREAGMKYLTMTSKHHDGFSLWPTAFSSYNITNSPFKRDIVGELAAACKKQGIKFCIYFTVLDWHDEDYPLHNPQNTFDGMAYDSSHNLPGNMERFTGRMKNQLKELITRYHPYMLWFDGFWETPWTVEYGKDIYKFIKKLDKNVVVNNRLGKGDNTKFHSESVGDYLTPEQKVGGLNMNDPWESCITICEQWAWKPNDKMKSLKECVQTLVQTSAGNGNLLFNVGPMLDGRIEARQVARLKEMGSWLKTNGESIYGTKGGPFVPNKVYATTRKGNKIYVHVFERPADQLSLPALDGAHILRAYFLKGNAVKFHQDASGLKLELPVQLPDAVSSVIVLEVDKSTELIPVSAL